MNLAGVDLNLLVSLQALLDEGTVSGAARRVGLSQPAMSHALARLRDLLGDPLFVRAPGRRLAPTVRAQALADPVRRILADVEATFAPPGVFVPGAATCTFTVVAMDLAQLLFGPPLARRLATLAPGVRLVFRGPTRRLAWEGLQMGTVDLAILPTGEIDLPPGLRARVLARDRFVCVGRAKHPRSRRRLSLADYAALAHVVVSPSGAGPGPVDAALAARGASRNVAVRVTSHGVALLLARDTDLVATVPASLARAFAPELRVFELPFPLAAGALSGVWHERTDRAQAHVWLREQLAKVARSIAP